MIKNILIEKIYIYLYTLIQEKVDGENVQFSLHFEISSKFLFLSFFFVGKEQIPESESAAVTGLDQQLRNPTEKSLR